MLGDNQVIIMCPPLADYAHPPRDMSNCERFDCPQCRKPMWLSEKKKAWCAISKSLNKEVHLMCYICIEKYVKSGKFELDTFKQVNI